MPVVYSVISLEPLLSSVVQAPLRSPQNLLQQIQTSRRSWLDSACATPRAPVQGEATSVGTQGSLVHVRNKCCASLGGGGTPQHDNCVPLLEFCCSSSFEIRDEHLASNSHNSRQSLVMACSPLQLAKRALETLLLALARQYAMPALPLSRDSPDKVVMESFKKVTMAVQRRTRRS